jgi:outer membrane protein OmpA-like peptidoglycan-associated protein
MNTRKTDRGIVVTLGDVLFDTGHWRLLPEGNRNMVKLAAVFQRDPQRRAQIEGFTDSVGGAGANYELSERRANAVMGELVRLGVAADHLSTRAHGADDPTASNATAAGRQLNRRVEIVFTPQGDEVSMK